LLQAIWVSRLSYDQAIAVAVHEIGHHATRGANYGLSVGWLCWPWHALYRTVTGVAGGLPFAAGAAALQPVVFVIAIVQVATQDAPAAQRIPVVALLALAGLALSVHPAADAALARSCEYAADRYAARHGMEADLAGALHFIDSCRTGTRPSRWRDSHPGTHHRTARLNRARPPNRQLA